MIRNYGLCALFGLLLFFPAFVCAQCSISNITISMNDNHDGIIVHGEATNCGSLTIRFTSPALPDKVQQIATGAAWSAGLGAAEGITAQMLQNNFFCNSTNLKGIIFCNTDSSCVAPIRGEITCTDSCPSVTLSVFNSANDSMNINECLPPGNYLVKPDQSVPTSGNPDYDWFINNNYQTSVVDPSDGFQVTVTSQGSLNVALSGHVRQCHINTNIDLNPCSCLAKDIELHIDSCNSRTGKVSATLEGEVISNPNEVLTATLTLRDSLNHEVAQIQKNSNLNDNDLPLSIPVQLTSGSYTAQLVLTSNSCSDTLIETFIINADSCSITQPPGTGGDNNGTTNPPPPPPPPQENQPGLDFCCVWMIINIILIIITLILIVIAMCAPNNVTISLAVVAGILSLLSFLAWLFFCSHWILIDQNFCDLLIQFMVILAWIVGVVAIGIAAALILIGLGVLQSFCAVFGLLIDLGYLALMLSICALVGHYICHCF